MAPGGRRAFDHARLRLCRGFKGLLCRRCCLWRCLCRWRGNDRLGRSREAEDLGRRALGLFEKPYADEARERKAMLQPDGIALAKKAAERSFVLLKNAPVGNGPLLPLAARTGRVALIGPLADDLPSSLGAWPGQGKAEDVVSLRAALAKRVGEQNLVVQRGTGISDGADADLTAAVTAASGADTVILALGEASQTMTGEAASRAYLGLPGRQQELLEKIVATGKPVVRVLPLLRRSSSSLAMMDMLHLHKR